MSWTPELKEQAKAMYLEANPTPENSVEIVKSIAEELDTSPNGVRMILSQMGVYIKKSAEASESKSGKAKADGPKRVGKEDAIAALTAEITERGAPVDEEILSKLTGKAAVYFTSVLKAIE